MKTLINLIALFVSLVGQAESGSFRAYYAAAPGCPVAARELPKFEELNKRFGTDDSVVFSVLDGTDAALNKKLRATHSGQTFLVSPQGETMYMGAIDKLGAAIENALSGQSARVPATLVSGTAKLSHPAPDVTYRGQVAPIFRRRCEGCHGAGGVQSQIPFQHLEDIAPLAETIAERVGSRLMPPWGADPKFGKFSNSIALDNDELMTLMQWIQAGSPEGQGDLPPARPVVKTNGWQLGTPDDVFIMEKPHEIPAEGVIPYAYLPDPLWAKDTSAPLEKLVYETGTFEEDKFLLWSEVIPQTPEVVHHVIVFVLRPDTGEGEQPDVSTIAKSIEGSTLQKMTVKRLFNIPPDLLPWLNKFYGMKGNKLSWELGRYVPGEALTQFPKDFGVRVTKGSKLVFEMHYTPIGKKTVDRTALGVKWAKVPPRYEVQTWPLGQLAAIRIPAGEGNYEISKEYTFDTNALLITLRPHAHLRGKDFRYTLTYPDGRVETLLWIPRYDFNNQPYYTFEKPVEIPKGATLKVVGHYDNSKNNPALTEAQTRKIVRFGLQTDEEMFFGYATIALDKGETK